MANIYDVNDLLDKVITEVKNFYVEEIFLLRDLFKGYEWSRIPIKDRLLLGTLFLNYINKSNIGVVAIEKRSSGQQKYVINT